MATETEPFETDDIYLAAYFMISGCVLDKRRKIGNKVIFVFSNPAGSMKNLREDFYSGKGLVRAHAYSQQVISCKKLCYDLCSS